MGLLQWYAVAFKQIEQHLEHPRVANEIVNESLDKQARVLLGNVGNHHLDTLLHSLRPAFVAVDIALDLDWNYTQIAEVGPAAALHDVGKIRTPVELLNKPGKLSPEEKITLDRHMRDGYDMSEGLSAFARFVMLTHHDVLITDRRNGSSHERRVSSRGDRRQEELYVPVRDLVALCERHDALWSKRPYHTHTPQEVPRILIDQYKGEQLFVEPLLKRFYKKEDFFPLLTNVPAQAF